MQNERNAYAIQLYYFSAFYNALATITHIS